MSEFGGLWKHENNQYALVPLKTECGGGIKNGHTRYPSFGGMQKNKTTKKLTCTLPSGRAGWKTCRQSWGFSATENHVVQVVGYKMYNDKWRLTNRKRNTRNAYLRCTINDHVEMLDRK